MPSYHNTPQSGGSVSMHTPYYGAAMQQYQSPQHTFAGMSLSNYLPPSRMTSFSTNRNDSVGSLTSSMPPGLSTQSSFSHAPTASQGPFVNQSELYPHVGVDFSNMGAGFEHDMRQVGAMFPSDEDDEEFSHLFTRHGKCSFQN
ncbi:hypothetical protein GJ744_009630 [Endocarpon pusillum]|uniref:Uncharacterized protein n=1 Tax=Endocarpon pusillum TaxID=364733 RepID=A0A8H7E4P5_9EURO|nr:hypothetical protein GJ744_009630 [Endocarpon pusillum]